jgi:hypothetical protein
MYGRFYQIGVFFGVNTCVIETRTLFNVLSRV